MGYHALLFCPDEKTARTVTPILSELDFEVITCTEPFAAVKQLMETHFDAVVVDCDNEQNATLLFRSAHSTLSNQTALAVALVEGQAGVAKAFRIGANLVLTKPINVEQAKGTLRVARGLLRKSEGTKAAAAAGGKTSTAASPFKQESILKAESETTPLSGSAAAVAAATTFSGMTAISPQISVGTATKKEFATAGAIYPVAGSSGAASAPAPAKEKAAVEEKDELISAKSEVQPESAKRQKPSLDFVPEKVDNELISGTRADADKAVLSGPEFAFAQTTPASAGSKTVLMIVAVIVLLAIAGYAAWVKFGSSQTGLSNSGSPAAYSAGNAPTPIATAQPSTLQGTSKLNPNSAGKPTLVRSSTGRTGTEVEDKALSSAAGINTLPGAVSHPSRPADAPDESSAPASLVAVSRLSSPSSTEPIVIRHSANHSPGTNSPVEAAAPNITEIASAADGNVPNVLSSTGEAPTPRLGTLNVSQGVSRGLLIKQISPSYPAEALRLRLEGPVKVLATVSKTGDISAVKILDGNSQLARSAADAVKRWKYKPYLLNGEPVEIQTEITVNFKLPK